MIGIWQRVGALACMVVALSACGGGGGGDSGPTVPPPAANRDPVASVAAAASAVVGAPVVLDGSASSDPDADALSYSWALTSTPQGSTATLGDATTAKASLTPDRPGNYGFTLTVRDGRNGTATATGTATALAATAAFSITATPDAQRPVIQALKLTPVGGVAPPAEVAWFVDLRQIGTTQAAGGHTINWDTTGAAGGDHQVLARVRTPATATTSQDIVQVVRLESADITLTGGPLGFVAPYYVQVRASAPAGIRSVVARLDGVEIGSLSAPNACAIGCYQPYDVYRFPVNTVTGTHRVDVVATDMNGLTRSINFNMTVYNAPQLQLTSPADGIMVSGSLLIAGSVSSDTGTATATATLSSGGPDNEVMSAKEGPFSTAVDLRGLTPGLYTLTVRTAVGSGRTEIRRAVYIAQDAAHVFTPAVRIPGSGTSITVHDFDGRRLVATQIEGGAFMLDLQTGARVDLAGLTAGTSAFNWKLAGTTAFAQTSLADCPYPRSCLYRWDARGDVMNLSTAAGTPSEGANVLLAARGDFVIWGGYSAMDVAGNGQVLFNLYRPSTGAVSVIRVTVGGTGLGGVSGGADLFVDAAGVARFYFGAMTQASGQWIYDLFEWRSDTNTARKLTDGARANIAPATDGTRLAWQASSTAAVGQLPFWLVSQTLPSGTAGMVSNSTVEFMLKDGVLAYREGSIAAATLKASVLQNGVEKISTLSTQRNPRLHAVSSGHVIFSEGGKLYSWSAAQGQPTVRLDTVPGDVLASDGWLTFTIGDAIYRLPLQ